MITRAATTCLVLIATAVSLARAADVRPEHPRIFITRATLPEVKKRCETTHKALFDRMKDRCDRGEAKAIQQAMCYLVTGERRYADAAKASVRKDPEQRPGQESIALDWIYDTLHLLKYVAARIARAKELEPEGAVRARINLVERNFLYCQDIANVYHLYRAYQVSPTWESFAPLAAALKQRDVRVREFIAHDRSRYDGFPPMFHDLERAITDGRGGSARMLGGPFKWNLDEIAQTKVLPDTGHRVPPFSYD